MQLVIAIDGPSGVGKSTLARLLAKHLGIAFLDTGAMFRILASCLGAEAARLSRRDLQKLLGGFSFTLDGVGDQSRLLCNGRVFGSEIRTEEIAAIASRLATLKAVRDALKAAQRAIGGTTPLVVEGRDAGTVVFPDARHKFFLTAAPEIRARRRAAQLAESGRNVPLEQSIIQIRERDELDSSRVIAPLKPAPDAVIIDAGPLDIQGVLDAMLRHMGE